MFHLGQNFFHFSLWRVGLKHSFIHPKLKSSILVTSQSARIKHLLLSNWYLTAITTQCLILTSNFTWPNRIGFFFSKPVPSCLACLHQWHHCPTCCSNYAWFLFPQSHTQSVRNSVGSSLQFMLNQLSIPKCRPLWFLTWSIPAAFSIGRLGLPPPATALPITSVPHRSQSDL